MTVFSSARPPDIPAIAELFQKSFPEALQAVFEQPHIPAPPIEDVFRLLFESEPEGFLLAWDASRLVGLMLVSSDLRRVHRRVAAGMPKLLGRWVTGAYHGLGLGFIPRLAKAWWSYRSADTRPIRERPMAQILSIAVDPAWRGQGLGKELSVRALAYLRSTPARIVRLEVDAAKPVPIALYRKMGFTDHATIPSPRGPALVMSLRLK